MINYTIQVGRLGKDPEVRTVGESKVANFSIATSEKYRDKQGELIETTQWHNIQIWGKRAEVVEKYVRKGDLIGVLGKIEYRSYEDKDGVNRSVTNIKANEIVLFPKGSNMVESTSAENTQDGMPF